MANADNTAPALNRHYRAWAATTPDGRVIANTVRRTAEDVRLAAGECEPVKVVVSVVDDWPQCPPMVMTWEVKVPDVGVDLRDMQAEVSGGGERG